MPSSPTFRRARPKSGLNPSLPTQASSISSSSKESSSKASRKPRVKRQTRSIPTKTAPRAVNRSRASEFKEGAEIIGGTVEVIKAGESLPGVVKKLQSPAKKLGKLLLWCAPLVLTGLEVRHEFHNQAHKRRMADKEYEKAQLEIQLELAKANQGKALEIKETINNEQGGPSNTALMGVVSDSRNTNPRRSQRERTLFHTLPVERSLSGLEGDRPRYRREGEIPRLVREITEVRKRRVRRVRSPRAQVRFERSGSWSESIHENYRSRSFVELP